MAGEIPPKIIKNETVKRTAGSLLYDIKLSDINANPALQNADTARKHPCFNPKIISLFRLESLRARITKPINSSKNVYLKIRYKASFISFLLSASNILLAFFS